MECQICNYQWCWICGYRKDAFFHKLTQAGLCEYFNYLVFGFEFDNENKYKCSRFFCSFVIILFLPVILYLICLMVLLIMPYKKFSDIFCFPCNSRVGKKNKKRRVIIYLVTIPFVLLFFMIIFFMAAVLASLSLIISAFTYFAFIFLIFRMIC